MLRASIGSYAQVQVETHAFQQQPTEDQSGQYVGMMALLIGTDSF